MLLEEFNTAPAEAAARLVRACADVERWVQEVVTGRPYRSVEELVAAAERAADPWTEPEIDAALARHPRIGERPSGDGSEARLSRREQAAVADADADVQDRIAAGNRAYEDRFGHVFLIRAAGRTPGEILEQLQQRLLNTPARERALAAGNLREIAAGRLREMVSA
ncbi:2-oxo-4-hydroxy-4-carboxy-5-ureidoimidazoline decarboxylase [Pseudactinotalea suaedae]|uniref:2-oxo-4-hydroxy-4-carboxy-5-ureidoimidazoline decarboxylase n=1 Tax=Pseudactinotalea suaedae TaxID=1524924 RepID=UPI0012E13208|nr:2-oxo-4-hydroxy-4-carboxy-5-ureidoimidazoline decarboxylase [Pseudactinotalea suaedae]